MSLIECVPNFSEGRDLQVVGAIRDAVQSAGVTLLGCESDIDHNRSVLTIVGAPDAVCEAAVRGACAAAERIDLRRHDGVHPRIGAADVIPFIPLRDASMDDCARIAHQAAEQIWQRARVPSYFYEFASPTQRRLEEVRNDRTSPPDVGGPDRHPSAGACVIGARRILIACNVNLDSYDLAVAKRIARRIRASSGGFAHVKALGFQLASQRCVQMSMNLTWHEVTPLGVVYDEVQRLAKEEGVAIAATELIGFLPRAAAEGAPDFIAKCRNFHAGRILENNLPA